MVLLFPLFFCYESFSSELGHVGSTFAAELRSSGGCRSDSVRELTPSPMLQHHQKSGFDKRSAEPNRIESNRTESNRTYFPSFGTLNHTSKYLLAKRTVALM